MKKIPIGAQITLIVILAMVLFTTYKIYNTKLIPFKPSKIICELNTQQIPEDYDSKSEQFKKIIQLLIFPKL